MPAAATGRLRQAAARLNTAAGQSAPLAACTRPPLPVGPVRAILCCGAMPNAATHPSPRDLRRRAAVGLAQLAAGMILALFLPGGFGWVEGWAFFAVFLLSSALTTLYIQRHDPALLERRLKAGFRAEQRPRQKALQALASFAFAVAMVVPA